jgi:Trypsin-co-occurring domain 2
MENCPSSSATVLLPDSKGAYEVSGEQKDLSLGQLIWVVRRELEWARQVDENHPLRFDVGSVELDVEVEIGRTTSGKGGLSAMVVGVGGTADISRETLRGATTKVHLVLTPRDTAGGKFDVSAHDTEPPPPWASDAAEPDQAVDDSARSAEG